MCEDSNYLYSVMLRVGILILQVPLARRWEERVTLEDIDHQA